MKKHLQEKLDAIVDLLDEVEGDTDNVTRKELREFLEAVGSAVEVREDGLGPEEDDDE